MPDDVRLSYENAVRDLSRRRGTAGAAGPSVPFNVEQPPVATDNTPPPIPQTPPDNSFASWPPWPFR